MDKELLCDSRVDANAKAIVKLLPSWENKHAQKKIICLIDEMVQDLNAQLYLQHVVVGDIEMPTDSQVRRMVGDIVNDKIMETQHKA